MSRGERCMALERGAQTTVRGARVNRPRHDRVQGLRAESTGCTIFAAQSVELSRGLELATLTCMNPRPAASRVAAVALLAFAPLLPLACTGDTDPPPTDGGVDDSGPPEGGDGGVDGQGDVQADTATDGSVDAPTDGDADAGTAHPPRGVCHRTSGLCWIDPRPFAGQVDLGVVPAAGKALAFPGGFAAGFGVNGLLEYSAGRWTAGINWDGIAVKHVWATPTGDVWTTGGLASQYGVARLIAGSWTDTSPNPDLPSTLCGRTFAAMSGRFEGVGGVSASDVWVVTMVSPAPPLTPPCSQAMFHWNGATWERHLTPSVNDDATAIYAAASNDIWAVGRSFLHWNGAAWSSVTSPSPSTTFTSVSGTSGSDIWAVGTGGAIAHYDGANWTLKTSPVTAKLVTVHAGDATHAWALGGDPGSIEVGSGQLLVWNGANWTISPLLTTSGATAATALFGRANDVWVATMTSDDLGEWTGGGNLAHWTGAAWGLLDPSPRKRLAAADAALHVLSTGDVFALGQTGLRWNGVTLTSSDLFDGVFHGWSTARGKYIWDFGGKASDGSPALVKWDGTTWKQQALFPGYTNPPFAFVADADNHVIASYFDAGGNRLVGGDGATYADIPTSGQLAASLAISPAEPGSMFALAAGDFWLRTSDDFAHHVTAAGSTSYAGIAWIAMVGAEIWAERRADGTTLRFESGAFVPRAFFLPGTGTAGDCGFDDFGLVGGIDVRSANDVWYVPSARDRVCHWNGSIATGYVSPGTPLSSVRAEASGALWVTGAAGLLYRPPGGVW